MLLKRITKNFFDNSYYVIMFKNYNLFLIYFILDFFQSNKAAKIRNFLYFLNNCYNRSFFTDLYLDLPNEIISNE